MSEEISEVLKLIAEKIKAMSPEEFRASLIRAGIIKQDGKLEDTYKKGEVD